MKIESKYKLGTIKNGIPFYGEVLLEIELLPNSNEHEIIEKYNGMGLQSQDQLESIPKIGYKSWRKGVRLGVDYALSMIIESSRCQF